MAKFSMTKKQFINQWLRHFARDIQKETLTGHCCEQHMWHVFSFGLLPNDSFLIGSAAQEAFDNADKADCICCDLYGSGGVTNVLSPMLNTAAKIDTNITEFYVVSADYRWTYIKTHEPNSGPYFYKLP